MKTKFYFYVLNYDHNNKKVINYNIFNNIRVQEDVERAVKKYLRNPKGFKYDFSPHREKPIYGFEAFVKKIDFIIMAEQWGRRQYEISVGDAFETNIDNLEKLDVYYQAKPNMKIIAHEVIRQYKEQLKGDN